MDATGPTKLSLLTVDWPGRLNRFELRVGISFEEVKYRFKAGCQVWAYEVGFIHSPTLKRTLYALTKTSNINPASYASMTPSPGFLHGRLDSW